MLLAALSTDQKIGLALVGAAFVTFALLSSFVFPRIRPDFPGRRGLPVFLTFSVVLFVAMMSAVIFVARETSSSEAAVGGATTAGTTTAAATTQATTTAATSTATTSTTAATTTAAATTTTAAAASTKDAVSETEFKIALAQKSLKAGPYEFDLKNDGHIGHDLVISGPGVANAKTPVINSGKTAVLKVDLQKGTYELYCSVPGHKAAGMDVKITVS